MRRAIQYRDLADTMAQHLSKQSAGYKLPNVRDIAKEYSVSVFTVSKALNVLSVRGIIERRWGVGCFLQAKGREKSIKGGAIGIVVDPSTPLRSTWSHSIVDGLSEALKAEGSKPVYVSWRDAATIDQKLNGLIVNAHVLEKGIYPWIKNVSAGGMPVVAVDCEIPGCSSVMIDNAGGAAQAARYLVHLGHRKIAYAGIAGNWNSDERLAGLRKVLAEAGIEHSDDLFWNTSISPRSIYSLFSGYYNAHKFSAIMAFEDGSAVAMIKAAQDMGVNVPADLSVVGFGNLELAEFASIPLTTVAVSTQELASRAAKLIHEILANPDQPASKVRIAAQLIVRETTAPAVASTTR